MIAAIAALAPLVAGVLALGVLTPIAIAAPSLCGVLIPHAIATMLLPVAGAAAVVTYLFDLGVCAGTAGPDAAAWDAVRKVRMPLLASLVLAVVWRVLLWLPVEGSAGVHSMDVTAIAAAVAAACGALACLFFLPLALGAVLVSEGHVSSANRRREWRERILAVLEYAAIPRWAASVVGIAVVITALAIFGSPRSQVSGAIGAHRVLFLLVVAVVGLAGALVARDWRGIVSCAVSSALAAIWATAFMTKAMPIDIAGAGTLSGVLRADITVVAAAIGAGFSLLVMARVAAYRRLDDPLDVALAHAWREVVPATTGITVAFAAIMAPLGLAFAPISCAVCGLVLTPTLAVLTETVFPKLKSVEELYGKKRVEPS